MIKCTILAAGPGPQSMARFSHKTYLHFFTRFLWLNVFIVTILKLVTYTYIQIATSQGGGHAKKWSYFFPPKERDSVVGSEFFFWRSKCSKQGPLINLWPRFQKDFRLRLNLGVVLARCHWRNLSACKACAAMAPWPKSAVQKSNDETREVHSHSEDRFASLARHTATSGWCRCALFWGKRLSSRDCRKKTWIVRVLRASLTLTCWASWIELYLLCSLSSFESEVPEVEESENVIPSVYVEWIAKFVY